METSNPPACAVTFVKPTSIRPRYTLAILAPDKSKRIRYLRAGVASPSNQFSGNAHTPLLAFATAQTEIGRKPKGSGLEPGLASKAPTPREKVPSERFNRAE